MTTTTALANPTLRARRLAAVVEVALVFLLLFIFAGSPPPGDDEAHYLGKAKQYWNPDWLAGDFFLETPDAHVVFNWTIGWLTLFFSLDAAAWIGRCAAWLLLAIAWQRLSWAVVPRTLASVLTMGLFLVFQQYGTAAREWIVGGVEAKCFAWALVVLALAQLVRAGGFRAQGSEFREEEKEGSSIAAIPTGRGGRPGASVDLTDDLWRWNLVWPLLGLAAAFHVLVGGWAVVAALLTWVATKQRPTFIAMLPALVAGGLISLMGVVPALQLSAGAAPDVVHEAHRIYVFERLNHHLVIHDFPWRYRLQFLGALASWLVVCWPTRKTSHSQPLRKFILASLVIAIAGIVIDQATLLRPDVAASLLRFYWFRLADMLVPIGLALALAELWASFNRDPAASARGALVAPAGFASAHHSNALPVGSWLNDVTASLLFAALCLVPMGVIGWRAAARLYDQRSGAEIQANISPDDVGLWREMCAWIRQQTPASSRFLTPPLYQDFRWHAERSEVASWKDIPQNAAGIVEWRERNRVTRSWWAELQRRGFTPQVERRLRELAAKYDVQYVIVPRSLTAEPLALTPLYSNATSADEKAARGYTVYWIGPGDSASSD